MLIYIFFYSYFHVVAIALYISLSPYFPFPLENVTAAISPLCCIAFAQGHRVTAENLCRYSRRFNRVCPQSIVSEKMISYSAFRCTGRGPAVTHPSTDSAPSFLTWVIAWHRTPITHRILSVTEF